MYSVREGGMNEYMPYIVSIICSFISGLTSIIVCFVQINRNKKETEEKLAAEKDKIQLDYEYKIKLLREEYALKAGTQMVSDVLNKTVSSVYDSPAVKNTINRKAQQAMLNDNKRKTRKKK